MSDSLQPHRWQPTRLPRPWDSPGKNTGVGCHFLLQCMKVKSESEVSQSCPTLSDSMDPQPNRLLGPWDFPGKSTGVGRHCLLQYFLLELLKQPCPVFSLLMLYTVRHQMLFMLQFLFYQKESQFTVLYLCIAMEVF